MNDAPTHGGVRRLIDKVMYYGCSTTETDRRNVRHLNIIALVWAICYCAATYFLRRDYALSTATTGVMISIVALLGAAMLWSYVRFLRGCDELMRQLQLEALAFGFGISVLAAITWALFEAAGFESLESNTFVAIGIFAYIFGVMLGTRRYR